MKILMSVSVRTFYTEWNTRGTQKIRSRHKQQNNILSTISFYGYFYLQSHFQSFLINVARMYCSYPIGRVRMKFSPHVKVKNSFPRGRRPQGEEFFTFTRGENSFLPTRLGKSSILMYFCNKLQGEKNLISRKNFSTGKENHSFPTGREWFC